MKAVIIIFLLSYTYGWADSKSIEQSCNLNPIATGKGKTIEQSCNLRPLSIGRGKTIEQSCQIKNSNLQSYLKRLREYQERDTSSADKIRNDSALAAYRARLKAIEEKN